MRHYFLNTLYRSKTNFYFQKFHIAPYFIPSSPSLISDITRSTFSIPEIYPFSQKTRLFLDIEIRILFCAKIWKLMKILISNYNYNNNIKKKRIFHNCHNDKAIFHIIKIFIKSYTNHIQFVFLSHLIIRYYYY